MIRTCAFCVAMLVLFVPSLTAPAIVKTDKLPRLPGATLLVGYPPGSLMVTTGGATSRLQSGGGDWYVMPSISADGHIIASARIINAVPLEPRSRPRLTVSTYSAADGQWTDYKDLDVFDGSVAISPDGTKLACITRQVAGGVSHISVLDLRTGRISRVGLTLNQNGSSSMSWSPDGRRITFDEDMERSAGGRAIPPLRAIYILDVEAGTASKIADGMSPSWSPSGEWIAFYDYQPGRDDVKKGWYADSANRVSVIHPNGTGHKVLVTFNRVESLNVAPVWSPSSESLLVNKYHDYDKGAMDIYLLDLTTLKLTRKFKNTNPIFAWVKQD